MELINTASLWQYQKRSDDPDISVIIATYPASDHGRVSEHLRNQTFDGEWETIVINDADLDRCEARNSGIAEAEGEIVAFTDDDTTPPEDWLENIYKAFQENPDLVCLEGKVTGGPSYDGEGQYVGCNMAVKRDAVIEAGGWDSRYKAWREDTELGWRMERDIDGDCEYHDDVVMVHPLLPRTRYLPQNEKLLRTEYPKRYEGRMDRNLIEKLWRYGQIVGVVPIVNHLRNKLRS